MDGLEEAREGINDTDRQMAALFCRRMEYSRIIGDYKAAHGLPIRDEDRERTLRERNLSYIASPEMKEYYGHFLDAVIDISCEYQQKLREGRK